MSNPNNFTDLFAAVDLISSRLDADMDSDLYLLSLINLSEKTIFELTVNEFLTLIYTTKLHFNEDIATVIITD